MTARPPEEERELPFSANGVFAERGFCSSDSLKVGACAADRIRYSKKYPVRWEYVQGLADTYRTADCYILPVVFFPAGGCM